MRPGLHVASVALSLLTISALCGQEWTRFRGPNGTGVSDCKSIPVQWSRADYRWNVKLPGVGYSSPVVWGDRVFVFSADPATARRFLSCYSTNDGRQLWSRDFASQPHPLHPRNSYGSNTPTVDAERVYAAWATPQELTVKAFDHNGQEVWSRDLGEWIGDHGFGGSPVLHDGLLILHNAQQAQELEPGQKPGQSSMVALDCRTGKDVWKTPLPTVRTCYSVPFIFQQANNPPELICASTGNGVFSLDAKTGEQRWSAKVLEMRVVNSPITAGGLIFSSNGSGGYSGNYLVAVRPGPQPELAYELKNSSKIKAPYVTCFLAVGEVVYLIYDRGFAACIDAPTGNIRWSVRTNGNFSGSPVLAGNKIYCIDEDGVVWVIAADPDAYRLLAKNPLGEPSRSTPAISGGKMFLRTNSQLFCVGGKEEVAAR